MASAVASQMAVMVATRSLPGGRRGWVVSLLCPPHQCSGVLLVLQMAALGAVSSPMRGESWQRRWEIVLAGC